MLSFQDVEEPFVTAILWKFIHSSCKIEDFVEPHVCELCDTRISRITVCVVIKNIGRRLPLEPQCILYKGEQGDVNQSVRGNIKTRF